MISFYFPLNHLLFLSTLNYFYCRRNTLTENDGIDQVKYALAPYVIHVIARSYDIEHVKAVAALRFSFLIDKHHIVGNQLVNDLPLYRNIDDMLRMVDALQFHEDHSEFCCAQWEKGKVAMKDNYEGITKYLK